MSAAPTTHNYPFGKAVATSGASSCSPIPKQNELDGMQHTSDHNGLVPSTFNQKARLGRMTPLSSWRMNSHDLVAGSQYAAVRPQAFPSGSQYTLQSVLPPDHVDSGEVSDDDDSGWPAVELMRGTRKPRTKPTRQVCVDCSKVHCHIIIPFLHVIVAPDHQTGKCLTAEQEECKQAATVQCVLHKPLSAVGTTVL